MTNELTEAERTLCREIIVEEYKTIRQESMESINHRTQILSLGLATIGALSGGTLAMLGNIQDPSAPKLKYVGLAALSQGSVPSSTIRL